MNITAVLHSFLSGRLRDSDLSDLEANHPRPEAAPSEPEIIVLDPETTTSSDIAIRPKTRSSKMAVDNSLGDRSPIGVMPPELLARVFSFINVPPAIDIATIANCRLVCKQFHNLSSNYLITTVVIAERIHELNKLREVMDHPYFHKHVTHLLWDASAYEEALFDDPRQYHERWHDLDTNQESPEVALALSRDTQNVEDLLAFDPRPRELEDPRPDSHELPGDGTIGRDRRLDQYRYGDMASHLSASSGYWDYQRRWLNQRSCRENELALRYLHWAFAKLPKLKHLSYTDWRALSRHGESFEDARNRMFSTVVQPKYMDEVFPDARTAVTDGLPFRVFLEEISRIDPELESLWIGQNNFDIPELGIDAEPTEHESVLRGPFLDEKYFSSRKLRSKWNVMRSVRSLRLPVDVPSDDSTASPDDNSPRRMAHDIMKPLEQTLQNLVFLELTTHLEYPDNSERDVYLNNATLSHILGSLKFERLQSLVLRGWEFNMNDIGNFLKAHAETLRQIHLLGCFCINEYVEAWNAAVHSLGPKTVLEGAEVVNVRFEGLSDSPEPVHVCGHHVESTSAIWSSSAEDDVDYRRITTDEIDESQRHFDLFHQKIHPFDKHDVGFPIDQRQFTIKQLREYMYYHPVRDCVGERPDFERAILGKHENAVTRLGRLTLPEKRNRWQQLPIYPK